MLIKFEFKVQHIRDVCDHEDLERGYTRIEKYILSV